MGDAWISNPASVEARVWCELWVANTIPDTKFVNLPPGGNEELSLFGGYANGAGGDGTTHIECFTDSTANTETQVEQARLAVIPITSYTHTAG
jgi:hypothetical protein